MARPAGTYNTHTQAPGLQQVWQSMRIMRGGFTVGDLLTTAQIGESAVHKYCRALAAAGYLRLVRARRSGHTGSRDLWALVRDSGPTAPIRRHDGTGVFDPNTGIVWGLGGQQVPKPYDPLDKVRAMFEAQGTGGAGPTDTTDGGTP